MVVPPRVAEQLHGKFPDWRIKRASDLGPDDRALWLHAHPKECPGAITGHFKRAQATSYAVLLVPESNPTAGYKLIVASGNDSHEYSFDLLDHNDTQGAAGMVISRTKPGKYSDFEQTESVTIKLDSIDVEWIEKGAVLYYWNGGQYQTLQTSD